MWENVGLFQDFNFLLAPHCDALILPSASVEWESARTHTSLYVCKVITRHLIYKGRPTLDVVLLSCGLDPRSNENRRKGKVSWVPAFICLCFSCHDRVQWTRWIPIMRQNKLFFPYALCCLVLYHNDKKNNHSTSLMFCFLLFYIFLSFFSFSPPGYHRWFKSRIVKWGRTEATFGSYLNDEYFLI